MKQAHYLPIMLLLALAIGGLPAARQYLYGSTVVVGAALMFSAGVGAIVARPDTMAVDLAPAVPLGTMMPKQFGDWRES